MARLGYEHVVLIRRRDRAGVDEGLRAGGLTQDQITMLVDDEAAPAALRKQLGPDTLLDCKAENAGPEINVLLQQLQQNGWQLM